MATRSYGQYCGIAHALDVVGERWTLLVLRELLTGPKRFTDLMDALPGIGTGLMAARLRALEGEHLIGRRRLPPPAASTVYELTDDGRRLEPVLFELARWGAERIGPFRAGQAFRPRWAMVAMRASYDHEAARGVRQTYEFEIGAEVFHVTVDDGLVDVHDGRAHSADVRLRASPETFARIVGDPRAGMAALADGTLEVAGDDDAIRTCRAIFASARQRS